MTQKDIAIVILNWNGRKMLEQFLPSVVEHSSATARIVVADNASIFTRVGVDGKNLYFGNSLGYCKADSYHWATSKVPPAILKILFF